MAKLPNGGGVTADRDTMCLVASNFRVQPDQRRDEILQTQATFQLYSSSVRQYRRCTLPGKASTSEDVTDSD
jgi:hypothetical protein